MIVELSAKIFLVFQGLETVKWVPVSSGFLGINYNSCQVPRDDPHKSYDRGIVLLSLVSHPLSPSYTSACVCLPCMCVGVPVTKRSVISRRNQQRSGGPTLFCLEEIAAGMIPGRGCRRRLLLRSDVDSLLFVVVCCVALFSASVCKGSYKLPVTLQTFSSADAVSLFLA